MARFLDKYIRGPINDLIAEASADLPDFSAQMRGDRLELRIDGETLLIQRGGAPVLQDDGNGDPTPEDAAEQTPG
jgi:hypothetical protein